MALRHILTQGDPTLNKKCRPVTDFNSRLHTLLDDMADTLEESGGVGLAAPQVGVLRRVCVVLDEDDSDRTYRDDVDVLVGRLTVLDVRSSSGFYGDLPVDVSID